MQGELDSQKSSIKEQFAQDTSGWIVWEASVSGMASLIVLLLPEQRRGGSLLISCARTTYMGSSVWSIWFLWFFWCGFRSGRQAGQDGRDRPHEPVPLSHFPASPDRLAPKNYARSEGKSGEGVKGAIEQWPKQDMGIFSRSTVRLARTSWKPYPGSA